MRPEDITEQDENGKIKDTEGQLAADENRNETVETEVSQETHSEYKIPGKSESRVSYICRVCIRIGSRLCLLCNFGACRSAYQRWTETRTTTYPALHEKVG